MNSRIASLTIAALALLLASHAARADWGLSKEELRTIEQAYPAGQAAERAGRMAEALAFYMTAQSYTGGPNPNAAKAAQRAAQIAPAIASAEEKNGNHAQAAALYDQGGHFAAADRALMVSMRATKLDSPRIVEELLKRFDERMSESFQANHKLRLAAAGPYTPDAGLIQEVRAALAKGPERTLQREATAFSAKYFEERVAVVRSRPESIDLAVNMAAANRERDFLQKWPDDLVKKSLGELAVLREWSQVERNPTVQASIEAQLVKRSEERAGALMNSYSGAPELLEAAKDYAIAVQDLKPAEARIASIKAVAGKLGDEAEAKAQFNLAMSYFGVAGDSAKKQAAQNRLNQLMQAKLQPDIDAGKRAAEALRAQYSDPAKVEAMRKQALAMQAAAQAQRVSAERSKQSAGDLQKELGLK